MISGQMFFQVFFQQEATPASFDGAGEDLVLEMDG